MNNSNDTIGNRTRDLPACSAVPQATAPPRGAPKNRKGGGVKLDPVLRGRPLVGDTKEDM